jgi:hypothetical protein
MPRPLCAGQGAPAELPERARPVRLQRVARQYQHAVLAGKAAEAPGVAGAAGCAVAVQVQPAVDAGVHRRAEVMGVADRLLAVTAVPQVVLVEQRGGVHRRVEVELVQQHDVRPQSLQDFRQLQQARVLAGLQRRRELPGAVQSHGGIEGGETQLRRRGLCRRQAGGQPAERDCDEDSATHRGIIRPRSKRL